MTPIEFYGTRRKHLQGEVEAFYRKGFLSDDVAFLIDPVTFYSIYHLFGFGSYDKEDDTYQLFGHDLYVTESGLDGFCLYTVLKLTPGLLDRGEPDIGTLLVTTNKSNYSKVWEYHGASSSPLGELYSSRANAYSLVKGRGMLQDLKRREEATP